MSKYDPNATLTYRSDINEELILLRLTPDGEVPLNFEPGQYVEFGAVEPDLSSGALEAKVERRQYSIASAKQAGCELEFYVVLVPGGYFTPKLWTMEVGSRLWMNPKVKGKFTLETVPPDKDLVMISTGTGLAPFVSMYKTYSGSGRWRSFTIIHGTRYSRDLGYRDELEKFAADDRSFFYIPTVTREPEGNDWTGRRGRVQSIFEKETFEHITGVPFAADNCQVFLCGNPDMIDSMEHFLFSHGFKVHKKKEPGQIHVERYW